MLDKKTRKTRQAWHLLTATNAGYKAIQVAFGWAVIVLTARPTVGLSLRNSNTLLFQHLHTVLHHCSRPCAWLAFFLNSPQKQWCKSEEKNSVMERQTGGRTVRPSERVLHMREHDCSQESQKKNMLK